MHTHHFTRFLNDATVNLTLVRRSPGQQCLSANPLPPIGSGVRFSHSLAREGTEKRETVKSPRGQGGRQVGEGGLRQCTIFNTFNLNQVSSRRSHSGKNSHTTAPAQNETTCFTSTTKNNIPMRTGFIGYDKTECSNRLVAPYGCFVTANLLSLAPPPPLGFCFFTWRSSINENALGYATRTTS